jgi:hypothetical protein
VASPLIADAGRVERQVSLDWRETSNFSPALYVVHRSPWTLLGSPDGGRPQVGVPGLSRVASGDSALVAWLAHLVGRRRFFIGSDSAPYTESSIIVDHGRTAVFARKNAIGVGGNGSGPASGVKRKKAHRGEYPLLSARVLFLV